MPGFEKLLISELNCSRARLLVVTLELRHKIRLSALSVDGQ